MMNSKIRNAGLLLLLGFGAISSANAHDRDFFGLSLNFGRPAYYAAPEVYYDARPVYVRPRVVYYDQPVVGYGYYNAQPYYYDDDEHGHQHGHGHAYGHYKHHHHDDDDDD